MIVKSLRYTESHEWLKEEGKLDYIGITDYELETLGSLVFVDLAQVGDGFDQGEAFGAVESVKAASDLYIPVSGKVVEVNQRLVDEPELLNDDPFGSWIIKVELSSPEEVNALLDSDAYEALIK